MSFTIVLRVLWNGGVARIAVEESRITKAKLLVLRESLNDYDLRDIGVTYLRREGEKGFLTPLFRKITKLYAPQRGDEATVDLDLILRSVRLVKGKALYHDQFAGISGYLRKLFYGEDYALYLHETSLPLMGLKYSLPRSMEWKILKKAKIIMTNSKWNAETLKEFGISAEVLYPGCYPDEDVNIEREDIVLAVSMWDAGRRPELYGELARKIKGKVVMAGSWARKDTMEEFKRKYPEVTVTGKISEGELNSLYKKASLFIRFGFNERGPGMGVLEAMAHGTPVIVNDGLGGKEFVRNYENGFVVKDVEEAVEKVNEVLGDELRRKMIYSAWETAKEYSWYKHGERLIELMEKV
ncbi:glycosyltransferase [Metallosphaera yellowstonensis MK1]|jgi:glycosyltransferase involved in cell wall biosynthesis|uniref:Glycosyltransferase n=1 Tax=Metallosphaera yellowstonensis MK1 TaxID=671065 RepID=H2C9T2_9CREN|nr:glycosyltransferase family 4 protein [Metallosphaera yellowstonensis]EHP68908.1 glycosyltransferase [Metallosphaera yellowstonensis MK1]